MLPHVCIAARCLHCCLMYAFRASQPGRRGLAGGCPPVPSRCVQGAVPSGSWRGSPCCGWSRAITRGQPCIEMLLYSGRSSNLMSHHAGLETFWRNGMRSSSLKPGHWGLLVLVVPEFGGCLPREVPALPRELPWPLAHLPGFPPLCLQAGVGNSLASLPPQPVPLGQSCDGCLW